MALTVPVEEIVERSNNPLLRKAESWGRVLLGDIAHIQNGFAFKSSQFSRDSGMPLIRIRDVGKDTTDTRYAGEYDPTYVVNAGDLLVGMDGDFNCARWHGEPGLLNQRVCRIVLKSEVYHPKLLDYALPGYLKAIHEMTSSVTVKHLSSKSIKQIPLPLPPMEQQEGIVAEIEKQFSRLDEAMANLKRVKVNLKRYKAAVLKAAIEGKLTEEWRRAHPNVEPASKLLDRILAERRAKWEEAELAKMEAKGKAPRDDKWKEKYKEPGEPHVQAPDAQPNQWEWASVDQLGAAEPNPITDGPFGSNLKTAHYTDKGPRVIRLQNIGNAEFLDEKAHISEEHYEKLSKHAVETNDVIIAAMGRPAPRACLAPNNLGKAIVKADCIRFRPAREHADPTYLMYALNSHPTQQRTERVVHGVGRPRLNLSEIKSIGLPLPPIEEQGAIRQEVERQLSVLYGLETEMNGQLARSGRLRESILMLAFAGQIGANG